MLFSMEVKAAIPWSCYVCNSMEFHGIAELTVRKCLAVDSMERFHIIAGVTLGVKESQHRVRKDHKKIDLDQRSRSV